MRVLLVINARLELAREREISEGRYPRKDYHELQRATGADMVDLATLDAHRWTRLARRVAGPALAQALLAWTLSPHYDAVYADQETTGFALAALYKLPFLRGGRSDGRDASFPPPPPMATGPSALPAGRRWGAPPGGPGGRPPPRPLPTMARGEKWAWPTLTMHNP